MKKIILIILLAFNICYADDNFIISDSSLKVLKDAGINIDKNKKETINSIVNKYSKDARKILDEIKDINIKLNYEYQKSDINLYNIKSLILEKKAKEADFDYVIMSCDLDILELFSENEIKKIKYYIIFHK